MTNNVRHALNWNQFIEANLLRHNVICGVTLLTQQGAIAYQYGTMKNLTQNNWSQFVPIFKIPGDKHQETLLQKGFQLEKKSGEISKYTMYHQTLCSVYCTSSGKEGGLLICNLPYGILICVHQQPHSASTVVPIVEDFCAKLRT